MEGAAVGSCGILLFIFAVIKYAKTDGHFSQSNYYTYTSGVQPTM